MNSLAGYLAIPGAETRVAFQDIEESGPHPVELYDLHMHAWAAGQIFALRPSSFVDIGSDTLFCGILSQFIPVTVIELRPWPCALPGLTVRMGTVLALPYRSGCLECVTTLSVLEHPGLGRYGDVLDPLGSAKAFAELARVLAPGGHLILAVPISHTSGVVFSAHRIFTRKQVLDYLPGFSIVAETCVCPGFKPPSCVTELSEWGYYMWCVHLKKQE